jgi:hypothetical protein
MAEYVTGYYDVVLGQFAAQCLTEESDHCRNVVVAGDLAKVVCRVNAEHGIASALQQPEQSPVVAADLQDALAISFGSDVRQQSVEVVLHRGGWTGDVAVIGVQHGGVHYNRKLAKGALGAQQDFERDVSGPWFPVLAEVIGEGLRSQVKYGRQFFAAASAADCV